jgi:hypothetical protein
MSLKGLGQLQPIARRGFHLTYTSSVFIMQAKWRHFGDTKRKALNPKELSA